jgi:hypothetical protein
MTSDIASATKMPETTTAVAVAVAVAADRSVSHTALAVFDHGERVDPLKREAVLSPPREKKSTL